MDDLEAAYLAKLEMYGDKLLSVNGDKPVELSKWTPSTEREVGVERSVFVLTEKKQPLGQKICQQDTGLLNVTPWFQNYCLLS